MDVIRDAYYAPVRFFKDTEQTTKIHWYFVPKDRPVLDEVQFVQHEPWHDENGPRSFMYSGNPASQQGQGYAERYGGARRTPLVDTYTGHYCGNHDQWAGELLTTRPGDLGDVGCCAEVPPVAEASWWAEITACTISDPKYGHREVTVSGLDGTVTVLPDGRHGSIEDGAAWEGNRQYAVPKGAVVRMWHGSDGTGFFFARGNLLSELRLATITPNDDGLFAAHVMVWDSDEHPGAFHDAPEDVWGLSLYGPGVPTGAGPHHARYLGRHTDNKPLYAFRPDFAAGGSCADCNVVREDVDDITDIDPDGYPLGTTVFIPNLDTGAVGQWINLIVGGVKGWVDRCTCSIFWWCTPAGCVPAADRPEDATDGPFINVECCQAACIDTQCCPDDIWDLPPDVHVKNFGGVPPCICVNGVDPYLASSFDGRTIDGVWGNECSLGMGELHFHVECVELTPGYKRWRITYSWTDESDPNCVQDDQTAFALRGGGHPYSCVEPFDLTFRINIPAACCAPDFDGPSWFFIRFRDVPFEDLLTLPSAAATDQPAMATVSRPETPRITQALPIVSDCIHLGPSSGERRMCGSCRNKTELLVFGCDLHGVCTTDMRAGKSAPGIMSCGDCKRADRGYTPKVSEGPPAPA